MHNLVLVIKQADVTNQLLNRQQEKAGEDVGARGGQVATHDTGEGPAVEGRVFVGLNNAERVGPDWRISGVV